MQGKQHYFSFTSLLFEAFLLCELLFLLLFEASLLCELGRFALLLCELSRFALLLFRSAVDAR